MTIFFGTPHTRDFPGEFLTSFIATQFPEGSRFERIQNQPADEARNMLVEKFLTTDCKYLCLVDSDATWHPMTIHRLAHRNKPVIVPMFFMRKIPPIPTIGPYHGPDPNGRHVYNFGYTTARLIKKWKSIDPEDYPGNEIVLPEAEDDLLEVDGTGAHFILIKREVIEAIPYPWFRFTTRAAGEDFYFCRQVKKAGYKIYADLSVYTGHYVGSGTSFGIKELLMTTQAQPQEIQELWSM